jgi:hypothetical protein
MKHLLRFCERVHISVKYSRAALLGHIKYSSTPLPL